ncbi:MAG: winged helix-turn-helix domain-containing protein [Endomicrobium sp.]|nr:winged helix-turn-helix domain-containing protein [Endomicrobium sp.]
MGFTAGEIWRYLSENGEYSSIKLKQNLGMSNTPLCLALGWLSRECKVNCCASWV